MINTEKSLKIENNEKDKCNVEIGILKESYNIVEENFFHFEERSNFFDSLEEIRAEVIKENKAIPVIVKSEELFHKKEFFHIIVWKINIGVLGKIRGGIFHNGKNINKLNLNSKNGNKDIESIFHFLKNYVKNDFGKNNHVE